MNERGLIDSIDRLSLNSLSKTSPSRISFHLKTPRINQSNEKNKSSNLSHVPCKFFKQGTCTAGANCIFSHNPDPTSDLSVCKYFLKGNCKFGTKCALLHTMSPFISERTPNSDDTATKNSSNDSKNDTTSDHIKHSDNSDKSSMKTRHMIDQLYTNSHDAIVSSPSSSSLFGYLDTERLSYAHDISSFNQHPPFIFQSNLTSSIQNSHLHGNRLINQDPFIKQQEDLHDVNDFILPSSLNDLLTPNELQHRQQYNSAASSYVLNGSGHSYEMTHASWNIPFYANNHGHANPLGNYDNRHYESVNDIDILSEIEMNTTMNKELGHLMDYAADEGPFVMEDTSLESNLASENPENYAFIHHLISIQK